MIGPLPDEAARETMLSARQNDDLTRVGPGTPMGTLLRAYWLPLLYSDELPEPDGAPLRIRLLGENLLAFRDSAGRIGLLEEQCPHRLASLFYGRNEEGGLRCLYHGWKFDVEGHCVDMPNEPGDCAFRHKVLATAYPCVERRGIVWTFMGTGAFPALPDLGWSAVPHTHRSRLKYQRQCNWVQAMEGDFDSSHLGFLHRRLDDTPDTPPVAKVPGGDSLRPLVNADRAPRLSVVETPVGVCYGARRDAPAEQSYWRVTQFQMPFYTSVPAYNGLQRLKIWVPMDDTHTMVWVSNWSLEALDDEARSGWRGRVPASGFLPRTDDPLSRGRFAACAENDYLIDRHRQRHENYSGMEDSAPIQDAAMQESMGGIVERSREHLSAADAAIIRLRRRLLHSADALATENLPPPGSADAHLYRAHGEQLLLDPGEDWMSHYNDLMARLYHPLFFVEDEGRPTLGFAPGPESSR